MEQPKPLKLLDRLHQAIRIKHYCYHTEKTYVDGIRRFILFNNEQHLKDMGAVEVEAFLNPSFEQNIRIGQTL
jgi:acyl-ACP thioesterase